MSEKLQTPDEYLRENPYCILRIQKGKVVEINDDFPETCIDATGYTDGLLVGPDVPRSRKRVIEWGEWEVGDVGKKGQVAADNGWLTEYAYPEKTGCAVAIKIGKYVDALPVEEKPDHIHMAIVRTLSGLKVTR